MHRHSLTDTQGRNGLLLEERYEVGESRATLRYDHRLTGAPMYTPDRHDEVIPLAAIPEPSVGAPCPIWIANESVVSVAYYTDKVQPDWDGRTVRAVGPESDDEPAAAVRFHLPMSTMFGAPNDEAFSGHPLASRGLRPYAAFEIRNSSWIRQLDSMNSVHPQHVPGSFLKTYRHFVIAFHDSTFECVARTFEVELRTAPLIGLASEAVQRMGTERDEVAKSP